MAIFDEIGKKTKDLADTTRLNSMISDEEKKQKSAYTELGRAYYEKHAKDYETEFGTHIEIINESLEKVSEFKRQLQIIKGTVICPACGAECPIGASFCVSCGKPVPKEASPLGDDKMLCPGCGKVVESGAKFCTYCGEKLN